MTNSSAVLVLLVASVSIASCGGGGDKSPTPPPPSPVLTTVSVSLGSSTIHVGQSTQASATGLDQNNASIATGLVSWSSSSPGVASISAGGTITAITAGTTFIFGAAGNVAGQAALTVLPVSIATVAVTPAGTTIYVGQTKQLTATPADAGGNPLAGRVVTWSSADSTKATVSSTGLVTALAAGSVSISALSEGVTGSATITIALVPVASVTVAPAAQTIAPGQSVQVTATTKDSVGGVLQGRAVVWSTNNPAAASISAPGNPATVLGNAVGTATVTATSEGKSGSSTITVSGSAPTVVVTSVSPAPLTPGVVATVSGTGFSATPSSNAVTIEGVSVPVTAATTTQLSFTVPSQLPCRPTHATTIAVTVGGVTGQGTQQLRVGTLKNLAVGGSIVLTVAADLYCTELPAGTSGYVFTVFSTAPTPTATFPFRFRGDTSAGLGASSLRAIRAMSAARAGVSGAANAPSPSFGPAPSILNEPKYSESAHARVMAVNDEVFPMARRALQQRRAALRAGGGALAAARASIAVPSVGSTRTFRVNQFTVSVNGGGGCSSYAEITARLVYVGTKSLVYEDVAAPLATTMDTYLVRMGQEFDATMYVSDSTYFGDPLVTDPFTDVDHHLSMVFTPKVPTGLAGFVISCDFFARDTVSNQSSNLGEMFYGVVPTVAGSGFSANTPDQWLRTMRTTVVHEVKHIASMGSRLVNSAPSYEESWLEEGMARMAEEMWLRNNVYHTAWKGNATYAATVYCDVRPTFPACTGAPVGMLNHFATLWQVLGAPYSFSMFGRVTDSDFHFYAQTWSFVRWALDRYGSNESAFLRGITQALTTGVTTIAALTGHSADEMYGLWSLSQVWDDKPTFAANVDLQFPTWNTPDVYSGLAADFPTTYAPAYPFIAWTLTNSAFAHDNSRVHAGGFDLYQISGTTAGGQTIGLTGFNGIGTPSATLRIAISRTQ